MLRIHWCISTACLSWLVIPNESRFLELIFLSLRASVIQLLVRFKQLKLLNFMELKVQKHNMFLLQLLFHKILQFFCRLELLLVKIIALSALGIKRLLLVLFGMISGVELPSWYNTSWPYPEIVLIVLLVEDFVNGVI